MLNGLLTDISRVIGFCLILIAGLINNMIAFKNIIVNYCIMCSSIFKTNI